MHSPGTEKAAPIPESQACAAMRISGLCHSQDFEKGENLPLNPFHLVLRRLQVEAITDFADGKSFPVVLILHGALLDKSEGFVKRACSLVSFQNP